jgi:integrase
MGHSSIQVTVDLYGHLVPGSNKQAVDRLDEPVETANAEAESATIRNQGWAMVRQNGSSAAKLLI